MVEKLVNYFDCFRFGVWALLLQMNSDVVFS